MVGVLVGIAVSDLSRARGPNSTAVLPLSKSHGIGIGLDDGIDISLCHVERLIGLREGRRCAGASIQPSEDGI